MAPTTTFEGVLIMSGYRYAVTEYQDGFLPDNEPALFDDEKTALDHLADIAGERRDDGMTLTWDEDGYGFSWVDPSKIAQIPTLVQVEEVMT